MRPTVLMMIGAQKAATTWVHGQLTAHPDVWAAPKKEVNYWSTIRSPYAMKYRHIARANRRRLQGPYRLTQRLRAFDADYRKACAEAVVYDRLLHASGLDHAAYLAYIGATRTDAAVVCDASTHSALLDSRTFAEIAGMTDDVRFLFIMRDPLARLLSGVNYGARHYAAGGEARIRVAERMFQGALDHGHDVHIRFSRYDETIANLEAAVPRERILYLFHETLHEDGSREALRDFLGLSGDIPWELGTRMNEQRQAKFTPDAAQRTRALACLSGTYAALRARFGASIPEAWADVGDVARSERTHA
jgi:hypothetical protein